MCEFKRGEIVEVRDTLHSDWEKRIFLVKIDGASVPYICVDAFCEEEFYNEKPFLTTSWTYCRKQHPDLKMDDPLVVWNKVEEKLHVHRHFVKWSKNGCPVCWDGGRTSWTIDYPKHYSTWDYYEIPERSKK